MSETKPSSGPEHYPTKELPAVKVPENVIDALLSEVREMRIEHRASTQELSSKVDTLASNVEVLQHDGKDTRLRIGRMERELDEAKARQANDSLRPLIQNESQVNLKQDALLSELVAKVDAIASKPDGTAAVISEIKKAAVTPTGQKIVGGLATALLVAISLLVMTLQAQVTKLESKPSTVQPAPTVYLPVAAPSVVFVDGGVK